MKADDHKQSDLSSQQVQQALLRAAEKARQFAEQTGTPFVTRPAGNVVKKEKQEQ